MDSSTHQLRHPSDQAEHTNPIPHPIEGAAAAAAATGEDGAQGEG